MPEPLTFHRFVRPSDVPIKGLALTIEADAEERAALARALDLAQMDLFEAHMFVMPVSDGVQIQGTWTCKFHYRCVVTLQPFQSVVSEDFDESFSHLAPGDMAVDDLALSPNDVFLEPLSSEGADIGAVLAQCLSLALDPYPRKNDVVFEEPLPDLTSRPSPFAILAQLKTKKIER